MCLIARREAAVPPINMTVASRLSVPTLSNAPNSCVSVGVPLCSWSAGIASCPNCRQELRVTLTPCGKHAAAPATPHCRAQPCMPQHRSPDPQTPTQCWPQQPFYWPHTLCLLPTAATSPVPSHYEDELKRRLRLSGWYYGNLDWQGARNLLKDASIGAFLIRDSGDTKFMFSLSVQTIRGPTSVRLHFEHGYFRLDCDRPLAKYMPRFRCVVELVQYYTKLGLRAAASTVWVDREGCPHSPVLLQTPLRRHPPSLLHSARLAIHKALDSNPLTPKLSCAPKHRLLPLPPALIDCLGEYPYSI